MKTAMFRHLAVLFLWAILLLPGFCQASAADKPVETEGITKERVAGMSDEEVRKTLVARLEEEASARQAASPQESLWTVFGAILQSLDHDSSRTQKELQKKLANMDGVSSDFHRLFLSLSSDGSLGGAFRSILEVLIFIGLGLLVEKVVMLRLRKKNNPFAAVTPGISASAADQQPNGRLVSVLAAGLPAIFGLVVFFVTAYFSYFALIWTDLPSLRLLFIAVLLVVTAIRGIAILAGMAFSPFRRGFRLVPLGDAAAASCRRVVVWTWGYAVTAIMFIILVQKLGARPGTIFLVKAFAATLLLGAAAVAAVFYRKPVAAYFIAQDLEETGEISRAGQTLAPVWHFFALLYLAVLWCLMLMSIVDDEATTRGAFLLSFFILPIWLAADRVLQWIVRKSMVSLSLYREEPSSPSSTETMTDRSEGNELYFRTRFYTRLALFAAIVLWVANLWGYNIPFVSGFSRVIFDTLIIIALALLFWQFVSSWIERKIRESTPEGAEKHDDGDEEWGGAAAQGRSYTLLPIIRSFVASVLFIIVILTILSSLGVNIGPLLAGAGVVGLAVGFGAQKIVSDIFSGVFYLLDDAFRVGEYLTAGGITGTVEKITLRNVMLRHHRGMLQIVPYSALGTVTNYMRGGIIEKFNLDFAYDANIDKIRKIIKKVGEEMLEDSEMGKNFISPLKSQGVREITNSVMTIRVKFTAKPGTQFVIRREAYKRITAAMQARGIQYAHRKVIVDLPPSSAGHEDAGQLQNITQAAGAAAREMLDEDERLKQLAQQK